MDESVADSEDYQSQAEPEMSQGSADRDSHSATTGELDEAEDGQAMEADQDKTTTCKCSGACKRCPCKKAQEMCDASCSCNKKIACVNREPGQEVPVERPVQRRRSDRPQLSQEDVDRIESLQRQQDRQIEDHIDKMTEVEMRQSLKKIYKKFPSLILDNFGGTTTTTSTSDAASPDPGPSDPGPGQAPSWCQCGRCREMPTLLEKKCCGKHPGSCQSQSATVNFLVMNGAVLFLALLLRGAYIGYRAEDNQPEDEVHGNRSYRHAAYRHFILWQYGRLGAGNRRVIPSCCVWRVRDRYPETNGQYTGYRPGRLN